MKRSLTSFAISTLFCALSRDASARLCSYCSRSRTKASSLSSLWLISCCYAPVVETGLDTWPCWDKAANRAPMASALRQEIGNRGLKGGRLDKRPRTTSGQRIPGWPTSIGLQARPRQSRCCSAGHAGQNLAVRGAVTGGGAGPWPTVDGCAWWVWERDARESTTGDRDETWDQKNGQGSQPGSIASQSIASSPNRLTKSRRRPANQSITAQQTTNTVEVQHDARQPRPTGRPAGRTCSLGSQRVQKAASGHCWASIFLCNTRFRRWSDSIFGPVASSTSVQPDNRQ